MHQKKREPMTWAADLLCLLVAAIWGSGFIASQLAIDSNMSAALIMALRFTIAAIVMLMVCLPKLKQIRPRDLKMGGLAGVFLFGAFYTQIVGQQHTTVSHCAFLTATNVVMVPFIVWGVSRRRPEAKTFALTATTLLGMPKPSEWKNGTDVGWMRTTAPPLSSTLRAGLHDRPIISPVLWQGTSASWRSFIRTSAG